MFASAWKFYRSVNEKISSRLNSPPEVLKQSYLPGLDGLRAISILFVLLGHILIGTWWVDYFPGGLGVNIFFVISGFIITTLLLKEKEAKGAISLKHFYARRSLRIFPVAYLYLFTLFLLSFIFNLHTTARMFLFAGLFIDNFPVRGGANWQTSQFWSLAVEEQFYLIFPFLLARSVRYYVVVTVSLLFAIPVIVMPASVHFSHHSIHYLFLILQYWLGFGTSGILIGSLTAIFFFKGLLRMPLKPNKWLSLFVFCCAVFLFIPGILSWYLVIFIFPALISWLILLVINNQGFLSIVLNNQVVKRIGVLSYSIYIWQQLFTFSQPWKLPLSPFLSLTVNILAMFSVAYCSYEFYERKFLLIKNRFK